MKVRELALKTVYAVEFEGAYSNLAVKEALGNHTLSDRDRALLTRLVYGTVDKKLTLDYIIEKNSKVKLKKLSKYILIILRMGLYQLKFMDKVPISAAVNESVSLARKYGHTASAGYVNALLRNASKSDIEYPKDTLQYLSVKYSCPETLIKKWVKDFGESFTEEMLGTFEKTAPVVLRCNTLKISRQELIKRLLDEGIKAYEEDGVIKCGGFDIAKNELYQNGLFTPQDKAAQDAGFVLDPKPGQTVIDMCAAPGAKTTHMAEIMENKGRILAFDIHEHKTKLIEKNAKRLGITIIDAKTGDAERLDKELLNSADKVLCDVPCSGHGMIGNKPDIKWSKRDYSALPKIQFAILQNAGQYLKRRGDIVYSTCTIEKEENGDIIREFLKGNENFDKIYEKTYYPNVDGTEGFYICKLRKL